MSQQDIDRSEVLRRNLVEAATLFLEHEDATKIRITEILNNQLMLEIVVTVAENEGGPFLRALPPQ